MKAYQGERDPDFGHVAHGGVDLAPVCSLQLGLALLANDDNAVLLLLCSHRALISCFAIRKRTIHHCVSAAKQVADRLPEGRHADFSDITEAVH